MPSHSTAIQSQEWIISSFYELLKEKPFSTITVSDIAAHALLDRRTFYRHFRTKEDVLKKYCAKLVLELGDLIKETGSINREIITKSFFQFWKRHIEFLHLLQRDNMMYFLLSEMETLLSILRSIIKPELDESQFTIETHYYLSFFIGGYYNLLLKWVETGATFTPEDMAKIITTLFPPMKD
jgi:AcrR family transcriptional regulator